jgi:nitrite reductase/ring-hydroxylating ferredoxin subunit
VTQSDDAARQPLSNRARATRWRAEFPYGWDADDLVSRRDLLRLAVWASGALFVATGALAGLGYVRERTRGSAKQIATVNDVAPGGALYFKYPGEDDHAILLRLDEQNFVAYSGKCTHLSCAVYWSAEHRDLVCPCHDGHFDAATGQPTAGPPQRRLPRITLRQDGDAIIAVEERVHDD